MLEALGLVGFMVVLAVILRLSGIRVIHLEFEGRKPLPKERPQVGN